MQYLLITKFLQIIRWKSPVHLTEETEKVKI